MRSWIEIHSVICIHEGLLSPNALLCSPWFALLRFFGPVVHQSSAPSSCPRQHLVSSLRAAHQNIVHRNMYYHPVSPVQRLLLADASLTQLNEVPNRAHHQDYTTASAQIHSQRVLRNIHPTPTACAIFRNSLRSGFVQRLRKTWPSLFIAHQHSLLNLECGTTREMARRRKDEYGWRLLREVVL